MIGTRLGRYEIVEQLGVGGMGEVYRARDTTLDREVAIKVLPAEWVDDRERLARLQREARVLAQLEHPNVAAIHGLESAAAEDGPEQTFLVMQLAEGETLKDWMATGRIDRTVALEIGLQIAAGLEAAHERGIVHRDLKPANVKVSEDAGGHPHVKILDFGLAKAYEPDGSSSEISPELSQSPTMMAATRTGMILGTAAYMSPEQARGKQVDKRGDIWAFGVVLFELLSGERLFDGETVSDVLASVLKTDPDWERLPGDVPPRVVRLLRRCLERDPIERLRDIGEARVLLAGLEEADATAASGRGAAEAPAGTTTIEPAARSSGIGRGLPWAIAAVGLALAAWAWLGRAPEPGRSFELAVGAPPGSEFLIGTNSGNVIVSPDGTRLAFLATSEGSPMLWVRPLSEDAPTVLPGTDGASYPFWSPEGTHLGFFRQSGLYTVEIAGGLPQRIAPAPAGRGGTWGADGTILFTPEGSGTVHRVDASGGTVERVTEHDESRGDNAHYWPQILPGAERFLYFARAETPGASGVFMARVDGTGSPRRIVSSMSSGIYAPPLRGAPGHLLWAREGQLLAQPFDAQTGELTGAAAPVVDGVRVGESQRALFASASDDGVLAWATASAADVELVWYDRRGLQTGSLAVEAERITQPTLSPDDTQLLFSVPEQGTADVWLHDIGAGTTRRVTTHPGYDELASWFPDGATTMHLRNAEGFLRTALDGSSGEELLVAGDVYPGLSGPAGDWVVVGFASPPEGRALGAVPVGDPEGLVELTDGSDFEAPSDFSPEGDWLLLFSTVSGTGELYAARWLDDGGRPRLGEPWVQISSQGTGAPGLGSWTDDGDEILYVDAEGQVVAVPVTITASGLELGRPTRLFPAPESATFMDVTGDGERFVVTVSPNARSQTLRVLTEWQSRLR